MNVVQNEWQQGEFECFKDMPTCCFGYFCATCLICKNASDLGESTPLYCLLACCIPTLGIFMLRQRAREMYGIEGDTMMDLACACCCPACANCQIGSEYKHRNNLM